MDKRNLIPIIGIKMAGLIVSSILLLDLTSLNAQVTYNPANELREARMGVERVARYYLPAYYNRAVNNNEIRWVQIDLGQTKKIEAIKLLPGAQGWGAASGGFPAHFKLEVSDDADFRHSVMYEDIP